MQGRGSKRNCYQLFINEMGEPPFSEKKHVLPPTKIRSMSKEECRNRQHHDYDGKHNETAVFLLQENTIAL
jgi:hypothetical protein